MFHSSSNFGIYCCAVVVDHHRQVQQLFMNIIHQRRRYFILLLSCSFLGSFVRSFVFFFDYLTRQREKCLAVATIHEPSLLLLLRLLLLLVNDGDGGGGAGTCLIIYYRALLVPRLLRWCWYHQLAFQLISRVPWTDEWRYLLTISSPRHNN